MFKKILVLFYSQNKKCPASAGQIKKRIIPALSADRPPSAGSCSYLGKSLISLVFLFLIVQPLLGLAAPDPRFTGKELDPTGLNYYGQRYYNNNQGRFTPHHFLNF